MDTIFYSGGAGSTRVFLPMLIGWYDWLARNEAKYEIVPISSEKIISKILKHLQESHSTKAYKCSMWRGDVQIAGSWKKIFPVIPGKTVTHVKWSKHPSN